MVPARRLLSGAKPDVFIQPRHLAGYQPRRRLPTCPTTHQKEIHMRLAVVFLFLTAFAHAQSFQGSLRGRIADPNGAVVPMAKITVTDEGTSSSRASVTSDEGEYIFAALTPATYTVIAEAPGFKRTERKGVVVATQSAVTIDIALELGHVNE